MQVTMAPALGWRPLRWATYAAGVLLIVINAWLVGITLSGLGTTSGFDFDVLTEASGLPNPYDQPWFVWSPVVIYPLRLLGAAGELGLGLLHFVWLIPLGWPLAAIVGLSWPFWYDLASGNVLVLIAVLGFLALRGNHAAALGFMVMALLIPRPLMLPLLVWLLWREPWTRSWFVALFTIHALAVLATGLGPEWIDRMLHLPGVMENTSNLAPSRWIGYAWWPISLVLASVAFRFGRLGVASLLMQPYVWPLYLSVLLWELRFNRPAGR